MTKTNTPPNVKRRILAGLIRLYQGEVSRYYELSEFDIVDLVDTAMNQSIVYQLEIGLIHYVINQLSITFHSYIKEYHIKNNLVNNSLLSSGIISDKSRINHIY